MFDDWNICHIDVSYIMPAKFLKNVSNFLYRIIISELFRFCAVTDIAGNPSYFNGINNSIKEDILCKSDSEGQSQKKIQMWIVYSVQRCYFSSSDRYRTYAEEVFLDDCCAHVTCVAENQYFSYIGVIWYASCNNILYYIISKFHLCHFLF